MQSGQSGQSGQSATIAIVGDDYPENPQSPFATQTYGIAGVTPGDITLPANVRFPLRNFAPGWRSWVFLAEFARTTWVETVRINPPPGPRKTLVEIGTLLGYVTTERNPALGEIKAQSAAFTPYFYDLLTFSPGTHCATDTVIAVAVDVGLMVAMHFKNHFMRPRPTQISPALLPAIVVPGHPAYPSGHSLQSHLVAQCLSYVLSPRVEWCELLMALAARISINREYAGLHYPSDTEAGQRLAAQTFEILRGIASFDCLLCDAKKEWVS